MNGRKQPPTLARTAPFLSSLLLATVLLLSAAPLAALAEPESVWTSRADGVRDAFRDAFQQYHDHAWGADELDTSSKGPHEWLGLGATIPSAMDTALVMGLVREFDGALSWVRSALGEKIEAAARGPQSTFETTIRVLGGLLGAYELSGEPVLVERAQQLADGMLAAFDSDSGVPYPAVASDGSRTSGSTISLAEAGTLQLEWRHLSFLTGDGRYAAAADKAWDALASLPSAQDSGLFPTQWFSSSGSPVSPGSPAVTLGGGGDSFYEYTLKQWLHTNRTEARFIDLFRRSAAGIRSRLERRSTPSGLLYVDALDSGGRQTGTFGHLQCFAGAMFALFDSAAEGLDASDDGAGIAETCYEMYRRTEATGVAPETVAFTDGADFAPGGSRYYILRPEAFETLYYMHALTGDEKYRQWGWTMWRAVEAACRRPGGSFGGLHDVTRRGGDPGGEPTQQAFFFSETLKYAFLLFSPREGVPLVARTPREESASGYRVANPGPPRPCLVNARDWVMTTEAHPLRVWPGRTADAGGQGGWLPGCPHADPHDTGWSPGGGGGGGGVSNGVRAGIAVAALVGVAVLVYFAHTVRRLRRERLKPDGRGVELAGVGGAEGGGGGGGGGEDDAGGQPLLEATDDVETGFGGDHGGPSEGGPDDDVQQL